MGGSVGLPILSGAFAFLAMYLMLGGRAPSRGSAAWNGAARGGVVKLRELVSARLGRGAADRLPTPDACLAEMPAMLDVLTLGLTAGLSFDASLEMCCRQVDSPLTREFMKALRAWQMGMGTREESLSALVQKLRSPPVGTFVGTVIEALEFGSPLALTLDRQAEVIRDEQRAALEERIEKVPVKMLVPLDVLVVPAMLLAILGPLLAAATG